MILVAKRKSQQLSKLLADMPRIMATFYWLLLSYYLVIIEWIKSHEHYNRQTS